MKCKTKITSLSLLILLTGCSTSSDTIRLYPSQDESYSKNIEDGRASVVVYRESHVIDGTTVNVYINGEYLTSLEPNAYSQETVCATNQKLYSQFTGKDPAYKQKATQGQLFKLKANEVNFFKIVNTGNQPSLSPVPIEQAEKELSGLRKQQHTLRRVEHLKNCEKVLGQYDLSAEALFQFNGYSYETMLPKGRKEIQVIAENILQQGASVSSIKVVGHTDPGGLSTYNEQLSKQRAETVKQALVRNGIDGKLVLTEGKGDQELVVSNCRTQFPTNKLARQRCDQPNRRVEVIVYGDKSYK